jgi:hypothetical protein
MHYYERNIVEIKTEYTDFFINMISPLVFEGMKSIYMRAVELEKTYEEAARKNVAFKNPGVLKLFQHFLKGVPSLNVNLIEAEMIRIRDSSKHADIFDKLIKAVIKSNIVLLTYNASGKECKLVNEKFHEKIDINNFIHKIYIECAIQFYNNPELFWDKYPPIEIQKNKRDAINIIKSCVREAIIKILPLEYILVEYLKNDYIQNPDLNHEQRVRKLLLEEDKQINLYDENMPPLIDPRDNGEDEESRKLFNELNKNLSNMDDLILNKNSDDRNDRRDDRRDDRDDRRDDRDDRRDDRDNNRYEDDYRHDTPKKLNTEEEYNSRINANGYTFDLLNKKNKSKPNVDNVNNVNNVDNVDNGRREDSEDFNVRKQNIVEDKINNINSKEYYKAMFM